MISQLHRGICVFSKHLLYHVTCFITDDDIYHKHYGITFKEAARRKKKRFALADFDGDQKLTRDELADFLHPG